MRYTSKKALDPRRHLAALLLATSLAACGAEAAPTHEEAPEQKLPEEELPDPLGLKNCPEPAGSLAASVELPALSWDDGGDDFAAHCAFRSLDTALAGKRIICSGENDHGVAETTRWHAALARYLVHTAGVRVIALEADAASTEPWNRYLISGDPNDLADGFEAMGQSLAATLDKEWFVESLRALQAELPEGERLRLTGYDVAVQPVATMDALIAFLTVVEPDQVRDWVTKWTTLPFADAAEATGLLCGQLEAEREAYVAETDEETWRRARTDCGNLRDGFDFLKHYAQGDFGTGNATYREPGMIRNVEELAAELPEGEVLLMIGHNMHCAKNVPASGAWTVRQSPAVGTAIARSETLGSQYFMLAQMYERGGHLRSDLASEDFDASAESLSGALDQMTEAPALLIGADAAEPKMDEYWDIQTFGTHTEILVPQENFDGVLWVREVTAAEMR